MAGRGRWRRHDAGMQRIAVLILIAWTVGGTGAAEFCNAPDMASAPWIRESTPFAVDITVRNPHDRAVKVTQLDTTCVCSRLELDERFLLPGASTVLHIVADNHNRSGPQHVGVSLYVSDPEFEPLEVVARWNTRAAVQVDAIPPNADTLQRPADAAWQDVYRYVAKERPDDLNRLRKRIRLSCPEGEVPAGGLKLNSIDYSGTLWKFVPTTQTDGSILITATARDTDAEVKEGTYDEKVVLHTNHPDKAVIPLRFMVVINRKAGEVSLDPAPMPIPPPASAP